LCRDALADGVATAAKLGFTAIELSALRVRELPALLEFVEAHSWSSFPYVSVHAPTDYGPEQEGDVAAGLLAMALKHRWSVVVHPDCIRRAELWKPFGELLCIENMDKRKAMGRTVEELAPIFAVFPDATLCFDIAHARQVDATMTEAYRILRDFGGRIAQLHFSEVTSSSKHDRISDSAVQAFREVLGQLPTTVPVILETPVPPTDVQSQVDQVERVFAASLGVARSA
jgi:hypothetical protein